MAKKKVVEESEESVSESETESESEEAPVLEKKLPD